MSEFRQNLVTKEWVIIATDRANRPEAFVQAEAELCENRPVRVDDCPFCPGNEEPPHREVLRIVTNGGWQLRIVKNKYPALTEMSEPFRSFDGVHRSLSGVGYHEIVIETPRHNACPALQTEEEIIQTLQAFQLRHWEISKDRRIEHIICFKNHGRRAGTSLVHPHGQLIGLPVVSHSVRTRIEEARRYFDDTGQCVLCQMWRDERQSELRLVAKSKYFVGFIPYAAFSPFHLWIVPRRHCPSFADAATREIVDLGRIMRTILRKLYYGLQDPDYNYVIRSPPVKEGGADYLHWYVTIIPRVTRTAGFEMGSGMFINTALPEESAAFLRRVNIPT
jgi:UDPglucose--hexose-1-phosphate uridylyltransferase